MLMKDVLGADWQQLPPILQRHYALHEGEVSVLDGTMTIAYPHFMFPFIWLIHLWQCGNWTVNIPDSLFGFSYSAPVVGRNLSLSRKLPYSLVNGACGSRI